MKGKISYGLKSCAATMIDVGDKSPWHMVKDSIGQYRPL